MSNYRKNLMVGLTVLIALVLMGYMLMKFGAEPAKWFTSKKMTVELRGTSAEGISPGSNVTYLGVVVGQVLDVRRTDDNTEIVMNASVEEKNPPPVNVVGHIHTQVVGNASSISLEVPAGQKPQGRLTAGNSIKTVYLGTNLVPPEITQFVDEMRKQKLVAHLDEAVVATTKQIEHVGKLVDSLDATLNDTTMRADLKASLAHVRSVTETAQTISTDLSKFSGGLDKLSTKMNAITDDASDTLRKTQNHIDQLAKQADDRMAQLSKVLASAESIATKVEQGKGTAGMLISDPKLYESLVTTSKDLDLTIIELKHLVQQWQQEGAYIKLSK